MEAHIECLRKLCRVCGELISNQRVTYSCQDKATLLLAVNIHPERDDPIVHPPKFCNKCYCAIKRIDEGVHASLKIFQWTQHNEKQCTTCMKCEQGARGGRKAKPQRGGKYSTVTNGQLLQTLNSLKVGPSYTTSEPLRQDRFCSLPSPIQLSDFVCNVCTNVLDQPVETICGHLMCKTCLFSFLHNNKEPHCPVCTKKFTATADIKPPTNALIHILAQLKVHCEHKNCKVTVPLSHLQQHVKLCSPARASQVLITPSPDISPKSPPIHQQPPSHSCHLFNRTPDSESPLSSSSQQAPSSIPTSSNCQSPPVSSSTPLTPSKVSLKDVLQSPLDRTPTHAETAAVTHLVKKMLNKQKGGILTLQSGGQPLCLTRISKPRRDSSSVSSVTLRKRSQFINSIRKGVTGGSKTGVKRQLVDELKSSTPEERQALLIEAKVGPTVKPGEGLAMKAELSIPWSKLRNLKRWLRQWGVRMESEVKQRRRAKSLLPFEIRAENAMFTFIKRGGGIEIRSGPFCQILDLCGLVTWLLDSNDQCNRLTWHDGLIPNEEVWVKMGGDKGGGSFKMSLQLANVLHPNSIHNTFVFSSFEASDTVTNLHVGLDSYKGQIESLMGMKWKDKSVRIFMYGDYEFQCKMYGISGASGKHCCLWCTVTSSEMQKPLSAGIREASPARSLASLEVDHNRFLTDGCGNLKKAKQYNNVISKAFFKIPIEQVCLPSLHVSLGVFYKLFTLYETSAYHLDQLIALTHTSAATVTGGDEYKAFVEKLRERDRLYHEADQCEDDADFFDDLAAWATLDSEGNEEDESVESLREQAREARRKATELNDKAGALIGEETFSKQDGPCNQAIEDALKHIGVERQAYYSGTFVGNHVHKCLQEPNTNLITNAVVAATEEHAPSLVSDAECLRDMYRKLFSLFSECHNLYSKASRMEETQVKKLEENIRLFMAEYRKTGNRVSPKLHILEEHMVPWVRRWGVGVRFHSEQGAESIHATFNSFLRTFASTRNPTTRLQRVMEAHFLKNAPKNITSIPEVKKRRK